jgi:hypothetical protein
MEHAVLQQSVWHRYAEQEVREDGNDVAEYWLIRLLVTRAKDLSWVLRFRAGSKEFSHWHVQVKNPHPIERRTP